MKSFPWLTRPWGLWPAPAPLSFHCSLSFSRDVFIHFPTHVQFLFASSIPHALSSVWDTLPPTSPHLSVNVPSSIHVRASFTPFLRLSKYHMNFIWCFHSAPLFPSEYSSPLWCSNNMWVYVSCLCPMSLKERAFITACIPNPMPGKGDAQWGRVEGWRIAGCVERGNLMGF